MDFHGLMSVRKAFIAESADKNRIEEVIELASRRSV